MGKIDETAFVAEGARIIGDVSLKKDSSVWFNAVLRGDEEQIIIGEGSNIQDNCVVHCGPNCPTIVGKGVTVGHLALLHGCRIGDNTLIGMGSIVMNGAVIGNNCIIGAGSLITFGTVIPDNSMAFVVSVLKADKDLTVKTAAEQFAALVFAAPHLQRACWRR